MRSIFLFGKNEDDEDEVYIGQADIRKNGVLFRVPDHLDELSNNLDIELEKDFLVSRK